MTSGARPGPGSEEGPVLAPLSVLVGSALLVVAQLYLAIPLAPVIGEVLGSGSSSGRLGTSYALVHTIRRVSSEPQSPHNPELLPPSGQVFRSLDDQSAH
jgi:hypothetical protein